MEDKTQLLRSFDTSKLIDIIKNCRQYGYDNNMRDTVFKILKDRGITKQELKLTGNLSNTCYNLAENLTREFRKNSKRAFFLYIGVLLLYVLTPVARYSSEVLSDFALVASYIMLFLFILFLIKAVINQIDFYKIIGKNIDSLEIATFFLIGIPFYIFMYFYYRHKMKDELKLVR